MKRTIFVLFLCSGGQARADESSISLNGLLDAYYAWNANAPRTHANFVNGSGTTAKRANEINLNLAAVDLARDPRRVGFHLIVIAGSGADVVHAAERRIFRNIYQASLSYNAPIGKGLLCEAGIYPSHVGFETFLSKDNWNYTRGWMGEFSPYYQLGVKASYSFSNRWSGQIHILNGWQNIADNNGAKTAGTQVAFNAGRFSASFNTLIGPELPNDERHLRYFGDFVGTYKVTPSMSIAVSVDRGRQRFSTGTANWVGTSLWARYAFDERRAVATRIERFADSRNAISGASQTLAGATVTYEYRPRKNLILKIEARSDRSTAPVFSIAIDSLSRHESLALLGATVMF